VWKIIIFEKSITLSGEVGVEGYNVLELCQDQKVWWSVIFEPSSHAQGYSN